MIGNSRGRFPLLAYSLAVTEIGFRGNSFPKAGVPPKLPRFDLGCTGTPLASRGLGSREDTAKREISALSGSPWKG
jgi:hypothetical protein